MTIRVSRFLVAGVIFAAPATALGVNPTAGAKAEKQVAAAPTLVSITDGGTLLGIWTLTVRSDRRAVEVQAEWDGTRTAKRYRVGKTTFARLKEALNAARFNTLKAVYRGPQCGADRPVYKITYLGRTIAIDTNCNPILPARLRRLLSILLRISPASP